MCITASVGSGGHNGNWDVRCIQILVSLNHQVCAVDGQCGPTTIADIKVLQQQVGHQQTGLLESNDPVLQALRGRLSEQPVRETLWGTMANASAALIDRYWQSLAERMAANGIDTPLRRAHFLAQVGHECCDLEYQEEIADGSAYEGRKDLGNTEPGDGRKFKGRGLIQLTGRTNYTLYGEAVGRDFVTGDNPKLIASDPSLAVDVACWFWKTHNLNQYADQDDIRTVAHKINGGYNGLDDRTARLGRAKWFMKA